MAIDNLNYYSSWLPAWQQTDKYSSQPWCLKSKNLDIFSSSKSIKATAWSSPSQWAADIIKQDGVLILKTDGKVYDISTWTEVLVVDPSVNFPVYKVSYTWQNGTYNDAEWGTVQDMSVAYEWDEWKSFIVFTDKASYTYSKVKFTPQKTMELTRLELESGRTDIYKHYEEWYIRFVPPSSWSGAMGIIYVTVQWQNLSKIPFRFVARQTAASTSDIDYVEVIETWRKRYYYDPAADAMVADEWNTDSKTTTYTWQEAYEFTWTVESMPWQAMEYAIRIRYKYQQWQSSYNWKWYIWIDFNFPEDNYSTVVSMQDWDYNEYYTYLPVRDRKIQEVGTYYWIKWTTYQDLYKWEWAWGRLNWLKTPRYDFIGYMWWENDPWMDVVWMITWNEQVYMIGNMNWNWYIIPCDLAWSRWTPYIAYWCEFKWVANIDYLMYLVGEDRGISNLRVYNWQELVSIIGWNKESNLVDYIDTAEQYKFNWKMVEYRGDLVLATSDNRIFQYWQTFGGKGGTFIHEVPWSITELKADWKNLVVKYTSWANNYAISYQDDVIAKNYNTEWEAEYPIVLWNHLLEKEESDLYASYILPNSNCKLEFWGCANHYHFRTFKSSDSYTFSTTASYKLKGCTWNYVLKFIEKNNNYYTFRLEGDLPLQTVSGMKITDTEWAELITYTEYNHFRKIGEITTSGYTEWEFRFTNINNKLELPKSHSLQILVRGKGTANYTPELFSLDLVANQRDRW